MSGRKEPRGEKVERRKRKTQKIRKPILFAGISARLKTLSIRFIQTLKNWILLNIIQVQA